MVGGKGLFDSHFQVTIHHREFRQETQMEAQGMLLAGSLSDLLACPHLLAFLYSSVLPAQGGFHPQWAGPSHIKH